MGVRGEVGENSRLPASGSLLNHVRTWRISWQGGSFNAFPSNNSSSYSITRSYGTSLRAQEFSGSRHTPVVVMASSNNFITHDEIWDDSALINVWDEALQEYKVSESPRSP